MSTTVGTSGNDSWSLNGYYSGTLDGLGGVDTLSIGTLVRSQFTLTPNVTAGTITLDTVAGASGQAASHIVMKNMEILVYNNNSQQIDLTSLLPATVPTIVPTIISYSPANAASNVPTNSSIILKFNENIQSGNGNITIHTNSASGSILEAFSTASSQLLSFSQNTLTITPDVSLANNTHYFVTVDSGAIKDSAGNIYSSTASYDFTTQALANNPGTVTITDISVANQFVVGDTLTATVTDADGVPANVSYQWMDNGTVIAGAINSSYSLTTSDVGNTVTVQAIYTDNLQHSESPVSTATTVITAPVVNNPGTVTIVDATTANKFVVGDKLIALVADADGVPSTVSYQWMDNGNAIASAISSTYILATSDVGKTITVQAIYTDNLQNSESPISAATKAIIASPPVNTTNSLLTGTTLTTKDATKAATLNATIAANAHVTTIKGGSVIDTIKANNLGDAITGGNGADIITLGTGKDKLIYTAKTTTALKIEGGDKITGFTSGSDTIQFSKIAFGGLTPTKGLLLGSADKVAMTKLSAVDFINASTTKIVADTSHGGRFIFDPVKHNLWFDPKGDDTSKVAGGTITDGAAKDDVLVLTGITKLVASDIILV